jgi:hypothetical protein
MTGPAKPALDVEVECYAGQCGEQTLRRFTLVGRTIDVAEALDAWLVADHRYFKTAVTMAPAHPAERRDDEPMGAHHVGSGAIGRRER